VYLVENHIINNAIAADLRKGPLENAKETVVAHNLSDKISLRLSDGLDNFNENEVQEIVKFILNEENMFFGYNLSMDSRLSLVSKINSFERISRDY
jgi:hypothetical protein